MNISPKNRNISGKKVFVGLSGGVDSAVSAALLKERGFDVTGVFIKAWQPEWMRGAHPLAPCTWREERRDAMKICLALDIPFLFLDAEREYKRQVVDKMFLEYRAGRTPNPDVLCNREIKFGIFWDFAREQGADFIATGHYAQIQRFNLGDSKVKPLYLLEGKDKDKDQSYFLWTLTKHDLDHVLFPVGHLEKSEVRKLAKKFDLPVAEKKDSQGICFMGDISMEEFLSHYIESKLGKVLNTKGEEIGTHKGLIYYTIGQRHGFEAFSGKPLYVVGKNLEDNSLVVSNTPAEMAPRKILVTNANWQQSPEDKNILAQIRYRGDKLKVKVKNNEVEFDKPVCGLSLGQSIVFYKNDRMLGGAVMDKVIS